jgi:NAD(P)-dependent dehydrogenase (short-subunit alcohol dehydrogenase family)
MSRTTLIKLLVCVFVATIVPVWADSERPPKPQQVVLVTGAGSGIGRNITEHLAAEGYTVYAGARKEEDMQALNKIPNVRAIHLDVTSQPDIDNAVNIIRQNGQGLYGLVNNAGVAVIEPLTESEEKNIDYVMGVNVYGVFRITKAFSPLVTESKGHILIIGSLLGTTAKAGLGIYSMSKHAIEAYTDTLAEELAPLGVHVSAIEPGTYKSDIYKSAYNRFADTHKGDPATLADWQKELLAKGPDLNDHYPPPDKVAETALRILHAKNPERHYLVVPDKQQAEDAIRAAIRKAVQLNNDPEYTLDKSELAQMLDDAIRDREHAKLRKPPVKSMTK